MVEFEREDVTVRLVRLPNRVRAITVPDQELHYNVYVNSLLTYEQQQRAIQHELAHIRFQDFDCFAPIGELEQRAKEEEEKPI